MIGKGTALKRFQSTCSIIAIQSDMPLSISHGACARRATITQAREDGAAGAGTAVGAHKGAPPTA
jgi:hypothetical protein